MAKGFFRLISFKLDRKSAGDATAQMQAAFDKAATESGKNFYRELKTAFDKTTAELKEKLARGAIDEKEFKKQSEAAARAFNTSILKAMDEARSKGELTDREYVKLTKTLKKVGEDGGAAGNTLVGAFTKVAATLGVAFSVDRVVSFVRGSLEAAVQSEAAWNRVAGAISRSGESWKEWEGPAKAAANSLEKLGFDDDAFAQALDKLLGITGDVKKSLAQMGFAADIAARYFGGDIVQAAEFLGRVLNGDARAFREVRIKVDDVDEGIRILQDRVKGAAENELPTLNNQLNRLKIAAENAKKEFGFFALRMAGGKDSTEESAGRVITALNKIEDWFNTHQIRRWILTGPLPLPVFGRRDIPEAEQPASPNGIAADTSVPLGPPAKPKKTGGGTGGKKNTLDEETATSKVEALRKFGGAAGANSFAEREPLINIDQRENESQAEQFLSPWQRALDTLASEVTAQHGLFAELGEAFAAGGLKGIAKFALGKARENLAHVVEEAAKAISSLAMGDFASAALHGKAALGFGEAALAWKATAGVLGGGGSFTGNSSSIGILGSPANIGGTAANNSQPKSETHIYIDPLSEKDPRVVRVVGGIMKEAQRTDSSVILHRRTG